MAHDTAQLLTLSISSDLAQADGTADNWTGGGKCGTVSVIIC
jgi:hypothetical protein